VKPIEDRSSMEIKQIIKYIAYLVVSLVLVHLLINWLLWATAGVNDFYYVLYFIAWTLLFTLFLLIIYLVFSLIKKAYTRHHSRD
jgi:hypothetical protein